MLLAATRAAAAPAGPALGQPGAGVGARVPEVTTSRCRDDRDDRDNRDDDDNDDNRDDDDDHDDAAPGEACERDDAFGYLRDFDLEREDARRRLGELEAAAIAELERRVREDNVTLDDNALGDGVLGGDGLGGDARGGDVLGGDGLGGDARGGDALDQLVRSIDGRASGSDDDAAVADWTDDGSFRDPDAVAETLDADDDAAFDHPSVRDAIETGSAFTSTAFADASELENLELRHQRPSRWGRLDLSVAWRRVWTPHPVTISLGPLPHGPLAQTVDTADSLWLLATWSR